MAIQHSRTRTLRETAKRKVRRKRTQRIALACGCRDALFFFFLADRVGLDVVVGRADELASDGLFDGRRRLERVVVDSLGEELQGLVDTTLGCDVNGLRDRDPTVFQADSLLSWGRILDGRHEHLNRVVFGALVNEVERITDVVERLLFLARV